MSSPYTYTFTTAQSSSGQCPCSIWQDGTPSGAVDANDPAANNIGVEFQPSSNGTISGVRFYKESDNTGTHTGTLWTANGVQLATGTFTNESSEGWQELDFSTPVAVTAGTTYVASYHTSTGHYAVHHGRPGVGGDERAADGAGRTAGSTPTARPTRSRPAPIRTDNFWVDVVFSPSAPVAPSVTSVTPFERLDQQPGFDCADGDVL